MNFSYHELLGMSLDEAALTPLICSLIESAETAHVSERYHLLFRDASISLTADENRRVIAVMFYRQGYQGLAGFSGLLPEGLEFSQNHEDVVRRLGTPSSSGGGKVVEHYGYAAHWDRFDRRNHHLHVEYCTDALGIQQITLMSTVPQ